MVESVHAAKINGRGRCKNNPPALCSLSKKKSKLNLGFKGISEQMRGKGSFLQRTVCFQGNWCQCPAPAGQIGCCSPSLPGQPWLWSPLLAPQAEGTTSLLAASALCQQGCRGFQRTWALLHRSPMSIGTWAEPRHSRGKAKAKPRDSCGDTERPLGCVVSLGSLFFSLSFVTVQFLSPHHRATTAVDGEGVDLPQGPWVPGDTAHQARGTHLPHTHPPTQETIHCLRPLFFQ